jgi:hypothetical protein
MPSPQVNALPWLGGGTLRAERAGHPRQISASLPGGNPVETYICNFKPQLYQLCHGGGMAQLHNGLRSAASRYLSPADSSIRVR